MNRRAFVSTTALAAAQLTTVRAVSADKTVRLGLDHFAVRATGWNAGEFIDHGAKLGLDTVFLSELVVFESFEDAYLAALKEQAARAGVALFVGTGSICDSSNTWKDTFGTPEEHLKHTIRVAKKIGSPIARCYLGNAKDRLTDGGIQKHIERVIATCKACRSFAEGEGIKIAVENHAGDMHSSELAALVEAAGRDFVGVNIDPGNAVWALEDPMRNLEVLGPYTLCSSVRDSMAWETEKGTTVQWTAIGEGLLDFKAYARRFAELAPGVPLQVETISGFQKPLNWRDETFWKGYSDLRADDFAAFLTFTKPGKEIPPFTPPQGADASAAQIEYQKGELERSLTWLKTHI